MFSLDDFLEKELYELNKLYSTEKSILYLDLYQQIELENLRNIFSKLHAAFNELFSFMNHKNRGIRHYNANESRELISLIEYFNIFKANMVTQKNAHPL